jgi:hypothetical protein
MRYANSCVLQKSATHRFLGTRAMNYSHFTSRRQKAIAPSFREDPFSATRCIGANRSPGNHTPCLLCPKIPSLLCFARVALTASCFTVIVTVVKQPDGGCGKGGESQFMKRIIKVLVVSALMVVLMATTVSPAFAIGKGDGWGIYDKTGEYPWKNTGGGSTYGFGGDSSWKVAGCRGYGCS